MGITSKFADFISQYTSGTFVVPKGNTASRPLNSGVGTLYYNTDRDALENYTGQGWLKVSVKTPTVSSISGNIYSGNTSTLSFSGSGFGAAAGIVNFVSGAVNANATTSSLTDTSATVSVPASIYGLGSGNTVNITLTNSDGVGSGITQKTSIGLPTGGTITYIANNYVVHTFTSSGSFVAPSGFSTTANCLLIAGGGGGSMGGGGAGGYLPVSSVAISAGTYAATVGSGGAGSQNVRANAGSDGSNSSFNGSTAVGGGGGGAYGDQGVAVRTGRPGGSGGGGGGLFTNQTYTPGGAGTSGQGNPGAYSQNLVNGTGGGGGGAGAPGNDGNSGGSGGIGLASSISGSSVYRAGGGGAGSSASGSPGSGGNGGGGAGSGYTVTGSDASTNTGGGGGGGGGTIGGSGGSGVVIIRYQLS